MILKIVLGALIVGGLCLLIQSIKDGRKAQREYIILTKL